MDLLTSVLEPPVPRVDPVPAPTAVEFDHVSFAFDDHVLLQDISFSVPVGTLRVLLGASGEGKSILLKLILGLLQPDAGRILINGRSITGLSERQLGPIRADIGMMFQENALFDSLTVAENVGYRLSEESDMPLADVRSRVEEVLGFVGMGEHVDKMPAALSGGERRRVALARAIAARPTLVLLDDPTSGLDPVIAASIDDQIVRLRDQEHVTFVLVTHQIRDAFYIAGHAAGSDPSRRQIVARSAESARFMVLHGGRFCFEGTAAELRACRDPYVQEFLYRTLPPW